MSIDLEVDKVTSYEFIKQIYDQINPEVLRGIGKDLMEKSQYFSQLLHPDHFDELSHEDLATLTQQIFATKKISRKWTSDQFNTFKNSITELLHGTGYFGEKFNGFCHQIENLGIKRPYEVAGELLGFTDPESYWLWGNWMWNPNTKTGSLPLVLEKGVSFDTPVSFETPTFAEQYLRIGEALRALDSSAEELGIREPSQPPSSPFEVTLFLGAVFAVYMYTVTRLRMTKEFNSILPSVTELIKRLLGIYKPSQGE